LNNNCCHYGTHGKKSKRKRESKSIPAWLWPDVDRIAVSPAVPLRTTKRCTMWLWFWISGQAGRRKKQLIHGRTHIRGRSGGNRTRWFNWAHMLDAWSQKPKKEWTQIPKMKSLGAVGNRLLVFFLARGPTSQPQKHQHNHLSLPPGRFKLLRLFGWYHCSDNDKGR